MSQRRKEKRGSVSQHDPADVAGAKMADAFAQAMREEESPADGMWAKPDAGQYGTMIRGDENWLRMCALPLTRRAWNVVVIPHCNNCAAETMQFIYDREIAFAGECFYGLTLTVRNESLAAIYMPMQKSPINLGFLSPCFGREGGEVEELLGKNLWVIIPLHPVPAILKQQYLEAVTQGVVSAMGLDVK